MQSKSAIAKMKTLINPRFLLLISIFKYFIGKFKKLDKMKLDR